MVAGNLEEFPVLIEGEWGRLRDPNQIVFQEANHSTTLCHEIRSFNPNSGTFSAWVRVPVLSKTERTVLYLHCRNLERSEALCDEPHPAGRNSPVAGDPVRIRGESAANCVWDDDYRLVSSGSGSRNWSLRRTNTATNAITVEAWVTCDRPVADAIQNVVSQWTLRQNFAAFDARDASHTSGLDTTGFFGAVFDGRHVYFIPQHNTTNRHGTVLRHDTHAGFHDPAGWVAYDAGNTDGLNSKGYYGAVYDGRYVTFIPRRDNEDFHSRFLRFDTHDRFENPGSWTCRDVGMRNSFQSAAFDGRYIYCAPGQQSIPADQADPHDEGHSVTGMKTGMVPRCSGLVMRIDTRRSFTDQASFETYNAEQTSGLDTRDFDGAVYAGHYVYFAPLSYGKPLRFDTRSRFTDPAGWTAFDARPLGLIRSVGAIFDGRYVYYVPYGNTVAAVRHDTEGDFTDSSSWNSFDITCVRSRTKLGYDGAVFDGRFVYYIPYWDGSDDYHGEMLRYDSLGEFADPDSWQAADAGNTSGLRTVGFNGATFDGRYIYCAPWNDGAKHPGLHGHGAVLRYDTTDEGSSFSLRYSDCGHNGGLGAALPGPRFLVAISDGVISIAANQPLSPGRHHLAGVYDGDSIRLFIDGCLVNEQKASGTIQSGSGEVTVGHSDGGAAAFGGTIDDVRISNTARSAAWLATQYANAVQPRDFACVED